MSYNIIEKSNAHINFDIKKSSVDSWGFFAGDFFMLMKICKQCGKKLKQGVQCNCNKNRHTLYNQNVRDKNKNSFYHSLEWKALTAFIKARANGLDEYALSLGMIMKGNTVHHIYTIDEKPELKLSADNLIYVSSKTHNQIHHEYKQSLEKKKELQSELMTIVKKAGGGAGAQPPL